MTNENETTIVRMLLAEAIDVKRRTANFGEDQCMLVKVNTIGIIAKGYLDQQHVMSLLAEAIRFEEVGGDAFERRNWLAKSRKVFER